MSRAASGRSEPGTVQVRTAMWPQDLELAHSLLNLYFGWLRDAVAVPDAIRSKDRKPELAALGGAYQDGSSAFLLAALQGEPCGCATVQMLPAREGAAELKRLYVVSRARGCGAGGALILACAAWARQHGARELLLDTLPAAMPGAVRLYRSLGFAPTERYNENEGSSFAFFRLPLE